MKKLEEYINEYLEMIPEGASEIQIKETRRAFLAGIVLYRNLTIATASKTIEIAETELAAYDKEIMKLAKEEMNEAVSRARS